MCDRLALLCRSLKHWKISDESMTSVLGCTMHCVVLDHRCSTVRFAMHLLLYLLPNISLHPWFLRSHFPRSNFWFAVRDIRINLLRRPQPDCPLLFLNVRCGLSQFIEPPSHHCTPHCSSRSLNPHLEKRALSDRCISSLFLIFDRLIVR